MRSLQIILVVSVFMFWPSALMAAPALDSYTSDYFWILPHTPPAWFDSDGSGGFVGATIDGIGFSQVVIFNEQAIRLQLFSIGTVRFYISDKGIIKAASDIEAVSMYLVLA